MVTALASTPVFAPHFRSGRYQFRYWHVDDQGGRFALTRPPVGCTAAVPDLVNTAYRNADGSKTIYGIAFDLDAHRADPRWLDDSGRLDWPRMMDMLTSTHQMIAHHISHAVRSTGGKGIALVIAITPLPIMPSTAGNQRTAQNLQSRLIHFFNSLGLGADPGARGLERDYPNFQNPDRLLLENRLVLRRAEESRDPILTKLHAYLNQIALQQRRESRLYPDARAETGLAKLVGWLLGIYNPGLGLPIPGYLSGEDVWASNKDLRSVTGLSAPFLRGFLQSPPAWMKAEYTKGEGWRLNIPLGRAVQRLLPRIEVLLAAMPTATGRKVLFSVDTIKEPHLVSEDERNAWLTAMALTYKWHGFSLQEALANLQLRLQQLSGHETSRNCKQVRSIVRAIYRNVPETAGRFASRDLPRWMVDDHNFNVFGKKTSTRRGVAPVGGGVVGVALQGEDVSPPKLTLKRGDLDGFEGPAQSSARPVGHVAERTFKGESGLSFAAECIVAESSSTTVARDAISFAAVRWRQRVGIFDGDHLVLCVTKRHYRAGAALELLRTRPEYAGVSLRIHTPHRKFQDKYQAAIDGCSHVVLSSSAFGAKATYGDKMAAWRVANEAGSVEVASSSQEQEDPPF